MRRPALRVVALASALLVQVLASGLPLHAHEEHSASVAHIEAAHGGHDTVLLQDDERQKADGPVVALFEQGPVFTGPADTTPGRGPADDAAGPRSRPPVSQPPPRAPPAFL